MQSEAIKPSTQHTLTLPWVTSATQKFVFAEEMRKAFSLALVAGVNLIFSGPGGHAKSEFLTAAMSAITGTEPFIRSFGQGTSSEELYGGIDLDVMSGRHGGKATFQFNPELSFLDCKIAIFEELFDAPPRILTSLKDTLTARELRNGHQRHPMATKMIAAATNQSPQEIAEGGREIAALVERFPVQLEVKWDNYGEPEFMTMFNTVLDKHTSEPMTVSWDEVADLQQLVLEVAISKSMRSLLTRIIVELRQDGVTISPRTAMMGVQLARAAAIINGRDRVISDDIKAIAFLPGVHCLRGRVHELIEEYSLSLESENALEVISEQCNNLIERIAGANTRQLETIAASLQQLEAQVRQLHYVSSHFARREQILDEILKGVVTARSKINKIADSARNSIRASENDAARLKGIHREVQGLSNMMWQAKTVGEQAQIEHELNRLRLEISDMPEWPKQGQLRAKALASIESARNKRR